MWAAGPEGNGKEGTAALRAIHACEDVKTVREKAPVAEEKFCRRKFAQAAWRIADSIEETFCSLDFPWEHWRSLRTNNPLEGRMEEVRRRTRGSAPFLAAEALSCSCAALRAA